MRIRGLSLLITLCLASFAGCLLNTRMGNTRSDALSAMVARVILRGRQCNEEPLRPTV